MQITLQQACRTLAGQDNIVILSHQKPDGDTLGSAFGLLWLLEAQGKTARVECADGFPEKYRFLCGDYTPKAFPATFVTAVDVASAPLLGTLGETYPQVDLCIDHHKSNSFYATETLVDATASATTEIVYGMAVEWNLPISVPVANALFTGLTTDTGCFRYPNVTSCTHRAAATLIDAGADHAEINKVMFDTKTRGRLEVEKLMMDSMTFHFDGRCAVLSLPPCLEATYNVTEEELDGISSYPRRIEGVLAGVTIRQKEDGTCRVSLRTGLPVDGSRICAEFGGGGHVNAAGCTVAGERGQVEPLLLAAVGRELERCGL